MSKLPLIVTAAGLGLVAAIPTFGTAEAAVVGRDSAACSDGKPSIQVRVQGFKQPVGMVRVALYGEDGYLQKGRSLRKARVPVQSGGPMDICVAVPKPGLYAVAVHHDIDADKKKDRSDGGGYSRNPRLTITNLRPRFQSTAVPVGNGPKLVPVQLQYVRGLRIGPVQS